MPTATGDAAGTSARASEMPRALAGLVLAAFFGGMAGAPLQSLFPVYVEADLGGQPILAAGLRVPLVFLGGLCAVAGGALCDRLGRWQTFVLGLTGSVAAGGVFLTREPLLIALLCTYVGLMTGFLTTGGQSFLMAVVPRERMGVASALYFQSGTLGIALGSGLGGPLADAWGIRALGGAMAALGAMVTVAAALGLSSIPGRRPSVAGALGARAACDVRCAAPGPAHRLASPLPSTLAAHRARHTSPGVRGKLRRPETGLLLLLRYLPTCYWGAATQLLPLLIYRQAGTKGAVTTFAAVSLIVAAACQFATGRWCDRAGPRRAVMAAACGVAASAALTAVFTESLLGLYAFGIMGAGAAWSLSTTMPSLIRDVGAMEEQGTLVGVTHLVWSAGMLTGILGGGLLVEWHPGAPFAIAALLCTAACPVAARLLALLEAREESSR